MLACFLTLLVLSPVLVMTIAIETSFSADELAEMGIRLEDPRS